MTQNSAASNDHRCVNYCRAGERLATLMATAACGMCGARQLSRICVCGSVRFGSGWNKFVQLLIRSQNSNSRFVRSLEIAFENGRISDFHGFVTLTLILTLDWVILHTVMHHLLTSTYIPYFTEIEETFCGRMDGLTDGRTDIGDRLY